MRARVVTLSVKAAALASLVSLAACPAAATATFVFPLTPPSAPADHPGIPLQSTASRFHVCCMGMIRSMSMADVNEDGHADIIVGDDNNLRASVLLGDGKGGITDTLYLPSPVEGKPTLWQLAVAAGDVTGDGHIDIISAGYTEDEVHLYAGNGDGSFDAPIRLSFATGYHANAVAIADIDGNGIGDILVTNHDHVTILRADGSGGFQSPETFPTGTRPYMKKVAVADIDGDGHLDVATAHAVSRDAVILWGDGLGGFSAPQSVPVGPHAQPTGITLSDANGDGRIDVLVANTGLDDSPAPPVELPGSVSVLVNTGKRGFAGAVQYPVGRGPGRADGVVVGDVTGDGHADIVVSRPQAYSVDLLASDGHGGFATAISLPAGSGPESIALADMTGDGVLDILVANGFGSDVSLIPGSAAGAVGFEGNVQVGRFPHDLAVSDLNGDGHPDVVTVNMQENTLSVRLNDGTGSFLPDVRHAAGTVPSSIAVADVDGDGHDDLLVSNRFGGTVSVFLGDGQGGFAPAQGYSVGDDSAQPFGLALGDANGDGHLDIVTANNVAAEEGVSLMFGDGTGAFAPGIRVPIGTGDGTSNAHGVLLRDVTGDGKADIVVACMGAGDGGSVSLLVGDGSGGFAAPVPHTVGAGPVAIAAADVDADGVLDLVSLNTTDQSVSVLLGTGTGGFAGSVEYLIAELNEDYEQNPWPWRFTLADVDGDGAVDIVTANTQNSTVSVLRNDGSGAFAEFHVFETGLNPYAVGVADIDGDGRMDVVSANSNNDDFSVLFNRAGAPNDPIFGNGFD